MKKQLIKMKNCNDINEILQFIKNFDTFLINEDMDPETTQIFYQLMCKDYNGKKVGNILLISYILYKFELSPSLIAYFYLREKEKMNFHSDYNSISFYLNGLACTDHNLKSFAFNYRKYISEQKNKSIDEINYRILEIILHELWHIYQFSIDKNTKNPLEQLILNDINIFNFFATRLNYVGLHDFIFMIEHEADEYAKRMALVISKTEKWFSEEFIVQKEEQLLKCYQSKIYMRDENNKNIIKTIEMLQEMFSFSEADEIAKKEKLSAESFLIDIDPFLSKEKELLEIISKMPNENIAKINLGIISPLDLEENKEIIPEVTDRSKI